MKHLMVRYRVKKGKVEEVRTAIRMFVDAIRQKEPGTMVYEAYQEPDGVSFVHFMTFRDARAEEQHRNAQHTNRFVGVLYPACEQEPVFTELTLVRSARKRI